MSIARIFFRDTFFGKIVYHLSHHRYNCHPVEKPGYIVPEKYLSQPDLDSSKDGDVSVLCRQYTIVTWDGEDDLENPRNWPFLYKAGFIFGILFLTITIYMATAIYTPGLAGLMEEFDVDENVAMLPLSLFVVGYGLGANVLSPLSEHAKVGRTSIYIVTLFLYCVLQIPTALAKSVSGLIVVRFVSGLFASATLATGAASVGDVMSLPYIPVGLAVWGMAAICGPSLGPFLGSVLANRWTWRATFWFEFAISAVCLFYLVFFLPETYGKTILYRKARALRALTGNKNIVSEGELELAHLSGKEVALDILWRPLEILIYEPVVLLIDTYIALIYAIMYLWFEAFPLVFLGVYNFSMVETGATYFVLAAGLFVGAVFYIPTIIKVFTLPTKKGNVPEAEVFIPPAIVGSIIMPCGLMIFAWTASTDIHWSGCLVGSGFFVMGAYFVFQTMFSYLSFSFPRYLASVFASNNLMRSNLAAFFPIIGRYLFNNLSTENHPVAWGSMVLAIIMVVMISIPTLFYVYGRQLRAKSKYAN